MGEQFIRLVISLIIILMLYIAFGAEVWACNEKTPEQIFQESIEKECKQNYCFCNICKDKKKKEKIKKQE